MPSSSKTIALGTDLETNAPFTIPLAGAATKTLGIFGKKGSGKTWTAGVWVEQLLSNKIPAVVLDPVGRWWDLGLSADGRSPGFPIAVFGGKHGQVELTPDMGRAIARYVASKHVPTVVDLSYESKTTWRRVVADFCDELFRVNELPVHVVVEEAPEFIPQRIFGENAAVFGAVDKLVRLGRNRGIGMTVIGQRLQTTNKDTVSQVDALIVLRLVDPQGKKAAREWVMAKGEEERADEFVNALASLKAGSGYIWSPEWLETFAPVKFAARQTFHYDADRAATEAAPTGAIAQAVDTDELKRSFAKFMAAPEQMSVHTISENTRTIHALREQVENLQAALEQANAHQVTEEEIEQRVRMAVDAATHDQAIANQQLRSSIAQAVQVLQGNLAGEGQGRAELPTVASVSKLTKLLQKVESNPRIKTTATKLFQALAELYSDFPGGVSKAHLAKEAQLKPGTGSFRGALADLKTRLLIIYDEDGNVAINPEMLR